MQRTAHDILDHFRISTKDIDPNKRGRQYTTCFKCSPERTGFNKKAKCLGVNINEDGVFFYCNHCPNKGGLRYDGRSRSEGYQPAPGSISQRAMPKPPQNGYATLHKGSMARWSGRR